MRNFIAAFYFLLVISGSEEYRAQTQIFQKEARWGIKENEKILIAPHYDTIFNFDNTMSVCLACFKASPVNVNKFIKASRPSYSCNYLNRKGERLIIRTEVDTCGVFLLGKNSVGQFQGNDKFIIATVKDRKYLCDKSFRQITGNGYSEIEVDTIHKFIIAQIISEGNVVLKGLRNFDDKEIVPFQYSNIKILDDSLIVACTAGSGMSREDDVYRYDGKKLESYRRHIDLVTPEYVVHKIFTPKEYFIIYNKSNKEEKMIYGEEAKFLSKHELLVKDQKKWIALDLVSGKKTSYDIKKKN